MGARKPGSRLHGFAPNRASVQSFFPLLIFSSNRKGDGSEQNREPGEYSVVTSDAILARQYAEEALAMMDSHKAAGGSPLRADLLRGSSLSDIQLDLLDEALFPDSFRPTEQPEVIYCRG
jgi:hypothetical protein